MARGTDRDNPQIPWSTRVIRRVLEKLGFRNTTFGDNDDGLTPASGGGTTNFLRADGTWQAPGGGGSGITELTGDVTAGPGTGAQAATIPAATVTLAKIANAGSSSILLGSGASGAGASYAEIVLGTNLTMSGTTLNAASGGEWGSITGTLSNQSDLQTALDAKQALDALLTSMSAAGYARDSMFYGTAVDTVGLLTTTSFGRGLLSETSASTLRTTLGLGALATLSTVGTAQITDLNVTTAKYANSSVTEAKLAFVPAVVAGQEEGNPYVNQSTTTATAVVTHTIPADTLPGKTIRVQMRGTLKNNSGAAQNNRIEIHLGGTSYHGSTHSIADSSTDRHWDLDLTIGYRTTGGQFLSGKIIVSGTNSVGGSGNPIGNLSTVHREGIFGNDALAEDETADLDLEIKQNWVTSTTSSDFKVYTATVEYL